MESRRPVLTPSTRAYGEPQPPCGFLWLSEVLPPPRWPRNLPSRLLLRSTPSAAPALEPSQFRALPPGVCPFSWRACLLFALDARRLRSRRALLGADAPASRRALGVERPVRKACLQEAPSLLRSCIQVVSARRAAGWVLRRPPEGVPVPLGVDLPLLGKGPQLGGKWGGGDAVRAQE